MTSSGGQITLWMRLRNSREVIAGLRKTATQVGLLGTATERLARHMERASRRTWAMNQAMFTLRRYSYMITLGLTAAAAAVVKWGFQYNSQVQVARVAFGQFGLTTRQTNDEIARLYRIAAISPFLFTDITNTARRFMAFGIPLATTNRLITNLTDSLTAMGMTSGASLNRASLALAHMSSLGRVTGQIVYQLARDNVPIIQALETQLHLTGEQLRHVGTLGITAGQAMQALNQYIEQTPRFHGAALKFATSTWQGIITTTRDYTAQFLGHIEKPMFDHLQRGALRFLSWITSDAVNKYASKGNIAGVLGTINPALAGFWRLLAGDLRAVWNILRNGVIPGFMLIVHVAGPALYGMFFLLSNVLQFLGHHTFLAKVFFALLAFEFAVMIGRIMFLLPLTTALMIKQVAFNAITRIAIMLGIIRYETISIETGKIIEQEIATTKLQRRMGWLTKAIWKNVVATRAGIFMSRIWMAVSRGMVMGAGGQIVKLTKLEKAIMSARRATIAWTVALKAQAIALWTNPITWIVAAIVLLTVGLVVLYFKWQRFHRAVDNTWRLMWHGSVPVRIALQAAFWPISQAYRDIKALYVIYKALRGVWHWASGGGGGTGAVGFTGRGPNNNAYGRSLDNNYFNGGLAAPGHALSIPSGPAVSKIGSASASASGGLSMPLEIHAHTALNVDGRQMAEVVSKHRLDATARR